MKQNTKDYDIFKDVEPFDISKHIPQHVTTAERDKLQVTKSVHVGGDCYGTMNVFENKYIYNTTLKMPQTYNYYIHCWVDVQPIGVQYDFRYFDYTYYNDWANEVNKTKDTYLRGQEIKHGKFHYLWKDNSMQTQIDIEEQSVQAIAITNEQDVQTEQVGIDVSTQTDPYVNLAVNERDNKLTKFISKFYNTFSDHEKIEEFYNEFLNIMEHKDSETLLGDNVNLDYE